MLFCLGLTVPLNLNGSTHVRSAARLPVDLQLSNEKDIQVTKKDTWGFELILPEGSIEDYKGLQEILLRARGLQPLTL